MSRYGSPTERFLSNIQVDKTGCWLWSGNIQLNGYGTMYVDGRTVRVHRFSYEMYKGPIPKGMLVCHKCDVRNCVNPEHLWLGTYSDNNKDCAAKGRRPNPAKDVPGIMPRGEANGTAKLTDKQVLKIRKLYASRNYSQEELAEKFHVQQMTISKIIRRVTWTHI